MPSIFSRRRASEGTVAPNNEGGPPLTPTQSKLKSLFVPDSAKMKKRLSLSSPSALFKHEVDHQASNDIRRQSVSTVTPSTSNFSNATAASSPRTANGTRNRSGSQANGSTRPISIAPPLPSMDVLAGVTGGQSALAGSSTSPLSSNGVPWRPSYPLVASNSDYADIAPDGFRQANPDKPARSMPADENTQRRSTEFPTTPGPNELMSYPALVPSKPPSARPSPSQTPPPPFRAIEAPLTPPPTATVTTKPLPMDVSPATTQPSTPAVDVPSVAAAAAATRDIPAPAPAAPSEPSTSAVPDAAIAAPAPTKRERRPTLTLSISGLSDSSATAIQPVAAPATDLAPVAAPSTPPTATSTLTSAVETSPERPMMGSRKTSMVIMSPPMPRPIANLPTLTPTGAMTPSWGLLAREGGPKTPGFGPMSPRTPGASATPGASGGFPFFAPSTKKKTTLTEAELRKVAKTMPGLTREPSQQFLEDDGGDAGDDDEESDTEVDSPLRPEDDNGEEGSERRGSGSMLRGIVRPRGAVVPRATMDVVHEEEPAANTIADRRHISPPRLLDLRDGVRTMVMGSASQKSVWNLPTPTQRPAHAEQGSWMQFGSETPRATPLMTPGVATPGVPKTPAVVQTPGHRASSEYFIGSSSAPGVVPGTPGIPPVQAAAPRISAEVGTGAADVDADDDSGDESADGTESPSIQDHTAPTTLEPSPVIVQAAEQASPITALSVASPTRPALYSQVSVSMINLPTSRRGSTEDDSAPVTSSALPQSPGVNVVSPIRFERRMPRLDTIPSAESIQPAGTTPGVGTSAAASSPIAATGPKTPAALVSPTHDAWMHPPPTPSVANGPAGGFFAGLQIKRRRSADDINALPPRYEPPHPGVNIPRPREEEGREKLPGYSCGVHIEGWLYRKLEFIQPQNPSKQRSWKRFYCILHGTQFVVYKFDPHKSPLIVGRGQPKIFDITEREAERYEHVYLPGQIGGRLPPPAPSAGAASGRRASAPVATGGSIQPGPRGRSNSATDTVSGGRVSGASSRRSSLSNVVSSSSSPNTSTAASPSASSMMAGSSSSSTATTTMPSPIPISSDKERNLFPSNSSFPSRDSGSYVTSPTARRASVSSVNSTNTAGPLSSHLPFAHNQLIDQVSLQQAESGLAVDYKKRKNVLRVRAKGYQFLLQADAFSETICWIEAFQAATNISLDLDDRPMPKVQQLPRRRRRRPATGGAAAAAGAPSATAAGGSGSGAGTGGSAAGGSTATGAGGGGGSGGGASVASTNGPSGNPAAAASAAVARNEDTPEGNVRAIEEMDRMLAEDQAEERQTVA